MKDLVFEAAMSANLGYTTINDDAVEYGTREEVIEALWDKLWAIRCPDYVVRRDKMCFFYLRQYGVMIRFCRFEDKCAVFATSIVEAVGFSSKEYDKFTTYKDGENSEDGFDYENALITFLSDEDDETFYKIPLTEEAFEYFASNVCEGEINMLCKMDDLKTA